MPAEHNIDQHDNAILAVPRRATYGAAIVDSAFDDSVVLIGPLPRADAKTHPLAAIGAHKFFDIVGMEGRTLRPSIEFGFYPRHAKIGQGNPLTPACDRV
ncbi:hypothetical protein NYA9BBAC_01274 [Salinibacterium sp. NYA9b]